MTGSPRPSPSFFFRGPWFLGMHNLLPLLDQSARLGVAVGLQDVFSRLAVDAGHYSIFGTNLRCLEFPSTMPASPLQKAVDDAMEGLLFRHIWTPAMWKLMRWLEIGKENKLARARTVMDMYITESIEEKKKLLNKSSSKNNVNGDDQVIIETDDVLSSYMNINDDDDGRRTSSRTVLFDRFLRDTVVTLLVAGRDTISSGLSCFFCLTCYHPEVEAKISEELRSKD